MFKFILTKHHRAVRIVRNQHGFTLIEAVIGIALLSIVAIAVLMGVATSFRTNALADSQSTAMSLALSQVEELQLQPYQDMSTKTKDALYTKIAIPSGYSNYSIWSIDRMGQVVSGDESGIEGIIGLPWNVTAYNDVGVDNGIQKITIVIKQGETEVLRLATYKVK